MRTLRFVLAWPFLAAAYLAIVIALYLGGPKAAKTIVGFAQRVGEKAGL